MQLGSHISCVAMQTRIPLALLVLACGLSPVTKGGGMLGRVLITSTNNAIWMACQPNKTIIAAERWAVCMAAC